LCKINGLNKTPDDKKCALLTHANRILGIFRLETHSIVPLIASRLFGPSKVTAFCRMEVKHLAVSFSSSVFTKARHMLSLSSHV